MDRSHGVTVRSGLIFGAAILVGISLVLLFISSVVSVSTVRAWPVAPATAPATRPPGPAFVKPGGTGVLCLQDDPCGSIQYAIDRSAPGNGDTIYVAGGRYTGDGPSVITVTKSITLYGGWDGASSGPVLRDPVGQRTVLDGEAQRRVVSIVGDIAVTLDGLDVTGGYVTGDDGAGIYASVAHLTLRNCRVYSNTIAGTTAKVAGVCVRGTNNVLTSNLIFSNTGSGLGLITARNTVIEGNEIYNNNGASAVRIVNASAITVAGNTIHNNTTGGACYILRSSDVVFSDNAIYSNTSDSGDGGSGLVASLSVTVTIEGNTFLRNQNHASDRGALWLSESSPVVMINNIVADNVVGRYGSGMEIHGGVVQLIHNSLARNDGGGINVSGNAQVWLTNTILVSHAVGISVNYGEAHLEGTLWGSGVWANGADWYNGDKLFTGTVNLRGDPVFIDPDSGNYHIGPRSAAIDAGINAGVTTDIDGDARPAGAGYDIGADEAFYDFVFLPLVLRHH